MARMNHIGRTATTVKEEDSGITVTYHSTDVVWFNEDRIKLNTGGHRTVTTKVRMNQTSRVYELGYNVFQENHEWFVSYYGDVIRFPDDDIIIIDRRD